MRARASRALAVAIAVAAGACSSSQGGSGFGSGGDDGGGGGDGGSGGGDSGSFGDGGGGGDSGTEQCAIATLGKPGDAGQGNLFANWLDSQGGHAASNLGDQVLTAPLLAPYKMLVAQNVSQNHSYSSAEVKVLEDWVNAGGGFLTLTGYADPSEVVNVNLLLAPFGLSYGNQPILFGGGHTLPVTTWNAHPITQGITKIGIDNGYEALGTGSALASEQGVEVLRAHDAGKGHVIAWGDEWITYDSEWSAHPDYQVQAFWQDIVDWFQPGSHCKVPDPPK